jgi:hypothetical protein
MGIDYDTLLKDMHLAHEREMMFTPDPSAYEVFNWSHGAWLATFAFIDDAEQFIRNAPDPSALAIRIK